MSALRTLSQSVFAVALAGGVAASAAASPVFNVDFDTTVPTYGQGDGSGVRTIAYNAATGISSDGVGGTLGAKYTFDLSGLSGFTSNNAFFQINNTSGFLGATSADVNDYEVSFDIRADGMAGTSAAGTFEMRLGDAQFASGVTFTGSFSTITFNLGAIASDSNFDLSDFTASNGFERQFKFIVFGSGNADKFGYDSGNALYVDNFQINEVPEPASLALLGLGGLCMLARRSARS